MHARHFDRIWSEKIAAHDALQKRNDALRPLFDRLRPGIVAIEPGVGIFFASFFTLPTVEMIKPATIVADEAAMAPFESQILKEVRDRVRLDKVILFVRLARFLRNAGHRLSDSVKSVLDRERSPFVDFDPSKGLAPLHAALTDLDMDPLFSQVTSLFRCGICSTKLPYPVIAIHLVNEHDVANVPAYAHVPSGDFRKALKGLLDDLGHSSQLELSAFEVFYSDCRFDVTTRTGGGELRSSIGETWEQVVSVPRTLSIVSCSSLTFTVTGQLPSSPASRPPSSKRAVTSSRTRPTAASSKSSFRSPAPSARRTRRGALEWREGRRRRLFAIAVHFASSVCPPRVNSYCLAERRREAQSPL